jgi:arabinogalactan endo-1,4-beta-galactosidase
LTLNLLGLKADFHFAISAWRTDLIACETENFGCDLEAVDGNGWNPTDPNSENSWENQALFGFDGVALTALLEFEYQNSSALSGSK